MITVIVEYKLPSVLSRSQVLNIFKMAEGRFRGLDGLDKKYFTYDDSTGQGLSIYVWSSLEKANQCFTSQFAAEFEKVFNTKPTVRFLDTLMMIDNAADKVAFF